MSENGVTREGGGSHHSPIASTEPAMTFRITGLPAQRFAHLFGLPDAELARHQALRKTCDEKPGFPCRVSLEDAEPGESVLLVNYEHLAVDSPYRSRHAIYVRERLLPSYDEVDAIPPALLPRLLAVRGFDAGGMMIAADVVEGREMFPLVDRFLGNPEVAYLHAHFARRGCFAARIERN
jgi:hypothetical protein